MCCQQCWKQPLASWRGSRPGHACWRPQPPPPCSTLQLMPVRHPTATWHPPVILLPSYALPAAHFCGGTLITPTVVLTAAVRGLQLLPHPGSHLMRQPSVAWSKPQPVVGTSAAHTATCPLTTFPLPSHCPLCPRPLPSPPPAALLPQQERRPAGLDLDPPQAAHRGVRYRGGAVRGAGCRGPAGTGRVQLAHQQLRRRPAAAQGAFRAAHRAPGARCGRLRGAARAGWLAGWMDGWARCWVGWLL